MGHNGISMGFVIHLIVWVCLEIGVYRYTLEIAIFLWENDDKSWDGMGRVFIPFSLLAQPYEYKIKMTVSVGFRCYLFDCFRSHAQ